MKEGKFNLGLYVFSAVCGAAMGGLFSKAMYHKGKAEAYQECADSLQEVIDNTEKTLAERKEKES